MDKLDFSDPNSKYPSAAIGVILLVIGIVYFLFFSTPHKYSNQIDNDPDIISGQCNGRECW